MQARYKVSPRTSWFVLGQGETSRTLEKEGIRIFFEHPISNHKKGFTYFVEILKKESPFLLVEIFMPTGEIVSGWQTQDHFEVHWIGDPFDGRFNITGKNL